MCKMSFLCSHMGMITFLHVGILPRVWKCKCELSASTESADEKSVWLSFLCKLSLQVLFFVWKHCKIFCYDAK